MRRRSSRRTAVAAIAAAVLGGGACGSRRAAPTDDAWIGRRHIVWPPRPDERRSAPEIARDLERALAERNAVAVAYAGDLVRAGGFPTQTQRAAVDAIVDELPADALDTLSRRLPTDGWPATRVAYRRFSLALHRGDLERARALLDAVARDPVLSADAHRRLQVALARQKVDPDLVAVLLPLSGPFSAVGRELRAAVELAAELERGMRLVFVDTGGDERSAAAEVERLSAEVHPLFALGPVGQRESSAAAERAAVLGLPLLLLSPAEGLADPDAGVFRVLGSGEDRARAAARAVVARGFDAVGVFAPRDDEGRAQAAAFAEAARAAGARVVAFGDYDPTSTDLEEDVRRLLGLDPRTNPRLRQHLAARGPRGWKTFSPDVPFDLLFIPDGHERATLVTAFLVYYNVELRTNEDKDSASLARKHGGRPPTIVQLLGSAGWHHPGLLSRGGETIDGALVATPCAFAEAAELADDEAAEFAQRFEARTGRAPTSFAAEAFDGARLAFAARRRALGSPAGADLRTSFSHALASARLDEGVCASGRIGPTGELQRGVHLLRVEGDAFVLEEPAP